MPKRATPDPPQDIPFWFITYSDVITLLMTFFILLLTFATSEPEMFERMQVSMFGGGGATGIAGPGQGPMEKDAMVVRQRPPAGRMSQRGSETPPIHSDPTLQSLSEGLAALENPRPENLETGHQFALALPLLVDHDNAVTNLARQRLRMIGKQLKKSPYDLTLTVHRPQDVRRAITLAQHLVNTENISPGKIAVGLDQSGSSVNHNLRILLTRHPTE